MMMQPVVMAVTAKHLSLAELPFFVEAVAPMTMMVVVVVAVVVMVVVEVVMMLLRRPSISSVS